MKKHAIIGFAAGMYVMWLLMHGLEATAAESGILRLAGLAGHFLAGFFVVAVVFFFLRTLWRWVKQP